MKQFLLLTVIAMPGLLWAQDLKEDQGREAERIIITKKGTVDDKVNIVIDGDRITVNGQPVEEDEPGDITVKRLKIKDLNRFNWSPEMGFDGREQGDNRLMRTTPVPNKAMLGVITEKDEKGAKVVSVNEATAAEKAGLKQHDIITKVDGQVIETPAALSTALRDKKPGDQVEITYLRDGEEATTTATLTPWEAPDSLMFKGNGNGNFSAPGIDFEELMSRIPRDLQDGNGHLRFYNFQNQGPRLGVKIQELESGSGVKVIELEKGSDADKGGLRQGDIIKEANGSVIERAEDLLEAKSKTEPGETLKLKIDRYGASRELSIPLRKKIKTAEL